MCSHSLCSVQLRGCTRNNAAPEFRDPTSSAERSASGSAAENDRQARRRARILAAWALLGCALLPPAASAQTLRDNLWVANGPVRAVATSGGRIYLGGQFTRIAPATGAAVALDAGTGAPRQPYLKVVGPYGAYPLAVTAVAPDGSGGWYLGGTFITVLGQPRGSLAHIDAGGTLTSWNPGADGQVHALAVSGSTVYVGGDFTSVGGQARNRIAALDATSGAAMSWDPNADGPVYS